MAKEYTAVVEIADAEFDVRFVGQKRRDEISDANTQKRAGNLIGDLNIGKYQEELADEQIAGWRNVTRATAMRLGYEDFDALPEDEQGQVPYAQLTARKLYRYALRDRFANVIDEASRSILEGLARKNARPSASSASSPASTG